MVTFQRELLEAGNTVVVGNIILRKETLLGKDILRRPLRSLDPVGHVYLLENIVKMGFYGIGADKHFFCYFVVTRAAAHESDNLNLPRGKTASGLYFVLGIAKTLVYALEKDRTGYPNFAVEDVADSLEK